MNRPETPPATSSPTTLMKGPGLLVQPCAVADVFTTTGICTLPLIVAAWGTPTGSSPSTPSANETRRDLFIDDLICLRARGPLMSVRHVARRMPNRMTRRARLGWCESANYPLRRVEDPVTRLCTSPVGDMPRSRPAAVPHRETRTAHRATGGLPERCSRARNHGRRSDHRRRGVRRGARVEPRRHPDEHRLPRAGRLDPID